ncbi:MAG: serine--tRNA ligase [Bacteroidales bacterium]|nr:serine--tRNA ligase [Bacteroidales bacterium]
MLTLGQIRENPDEIIQRLGIKNFDARDLVADILDLDKSRRLTQSELDNKQATINATSRKIGEFIKAKLQQEAESAQKRTAALKEEIKTLSSRLSEIEERLEQLVIRIPNIPALQVPPGKTSADNVEVRSGGMMPCLPDNALPHWDLAHICDIIDFELGNKITGAGFPVYKGMGAKLQRALINFFLDENIKAGYAEVMPPLMVNQDSGFGTGQIPDKDGQMYRIDSDNLYLIPTAEVPVTNMYRDVILNAVDLPVKSTAYTPCFRREAGSYGKDVRGLNRLHQFDKVEIVQIQHPDRSYETLEEMVNHVEMLIRKLQLPYRIMKLCGGDMSFTSALTYDFEVFAGAQKRWLEVSSVSNFESFQSNRLKLRFREESRKKPMLAHTLNGSSIALPRVVAALIENNQTREGIRLPAVLQPYTGFDIIPVSG